MNDYSTVMATVPKRVSALSEQLGRKNFDASAEIVTSLLVDMSFVLMWINGQREGAV
jgi:hypothetical protein